MIETIVDLIELCVMSWFCYRGPANEWYEALSCHLRPSKKVRTWFAQHVLFAHPNRFAEYLLECPTSEVSIPRLK